MPSRPRCLQVLTAIELARQARIAANRAYLAGLRMGPSAMASGEVTAVAGQDALVLAAARQLAEKAALAEARSQVGTCDLPSCRLVVYPSHSPLMWPLGILAIYSVPSVQH